MKRKITLTALLTAAVLALPMGCQKEGVAGGSGSRTGNTDDFIASIQQKGSSDLYAKGGVVNCCPVDDATKTCLTGNDKIVWSDGDKILVKGATEATMTVLPFGTDATTAMLSGTAPDPAATGSKYSGYYPATTGWWDTATKLVTLPAEREYNAASPLDCVPMYAESDDKHFSFKPMFGLFEFTLTGGKKVNSIKIIAYAATAARKNISGKFGMDATGKAVYKSDGKDSAVVKFPGGIVPGKGFTAYIALPEGTYTKFTVIIRTDKTDTWGGIYSKVLAPADGIVINGGEVYGVGMNTSDWDGIQLWAGGCFWANRNIGAENPMDFGDFFAFGAAAVPYSQMTSGYTVVFKTSAPENIPGKYPNWSYTGFCGKTAPYYDATLAAYTKYLNDGDELEPEDDAAHCVLGGNWRMPTGGSATSESHKLYTSCGGTSGGSSYVTGYIEWRTDNPIAGMCSVWLKSQTTGKELIFPAGGVFRLLQNQFYYSTTATSIYGMYLTSTMVAGDYRNAYRIRLNKEYAYFGWSSSTGQTTGRYDCCTIRPVQEL